MLLIQTQTETDIIQAWIIIGVIVIFYFYLRHIKKINPLKYEKITSIIWGIIGILFLFWLFGKFKDDDN